MSSNMRKWADSERILDITRRQFIMNTEMIINTDSARRASNGGCCSGEK